MKIFDKEEFTKKLAEKFGLYEREKIMKILDKCCPDFQDNVLSPDMFKQGIKRLEDAASIASFCPDSTTVKDFNHIIGLLYFILGFRGEHNKLARVWYKVFGMVDPNDTQTSG